MKVERLRKQFTGIVRRPEVAAFKQALPKIAARLQEKQNVGPLSMKNYGRVCKLKSQTVFDFLYPEARKTCIECNAPVVWADDKGCYRTFCGQTCMNASEQTLDKRMATNRKRFGHSDPNKSKKIQRKKVKIFRAKYGVDNPSQAEAVKKRKRRTMRRNYGANHWTQTEPEHWKKVGNPFDEKMLEKAKQTCIKKYGFDNPWKVPAIQERIQIAHMNKYGCNPGAVYNGWARKIYEDKFGKRHIVMGYEVHALKHFERKKSCRRLITGARNLPRYRYTDKDGIKHNYHPDLVVLGTHGQYVVEVKSDWTLNLDLAKNIRKFRVASKSCIRKGHTFLVMVFDPRSNQIFTAKNPTCLDDLVDAGLPVSRHPA